MKITNIIYYFLRGVKCRFYQWKQGLNHVHTSTYIGKNSTISKDLCTEPYVYIGPSCIIYPKVGIGAYSMLSAEVYILGKDHEFRHPGRPILYSGRQYIPETRIGRDCWIGRRATIMLGLNIGDGCVICAGAVVTKDCEPFGVYGGVPARRIAERFANDEELTLHAEMLKQDPLKMKWCPLLHVSKLW